MRYLFALPLMILPLGVYWLIVEGPQDIAGFEAIWLSLTMVSGGIVTVTQGEALAGFAVLVLFLEVVKATRTGFAPVLDHVLSVLMSVVYVVLFVVWAPASTGLFGLLTLIALVDAMAGLWVSLYVARRDVSISSGGPF